MQNIIQRRTSSRVKKSRAIVRHPIKNVSCGTTIVKDVMAGARVYVAR